MGHGAHSDAILMSRTVQKVYMRLNRADVPVYCNRVDDVS